MDPAGPAGLGGDGVSGPVSGAARVREAGGYSLIRKAMAALIASAVPAVVMKS